MTEESAEASGIYQIGVRLKSAGVPISLVLLVYFASAAEYNADFIFNH